MRPSWSSLTILQIHSFLYCVSTLTKHPIPLPLLPHTPLLKVQISHSTSFFPLFSKYIYELCNDTSSLIHTTNSVLSSFSSDGVTYLELRTTPRAIPSANVTKDDYIRTILSCINTHPSTSSPNPKMKTNLILSIDRRNDLPTALEVVALALKFRSAGVVGIDLCGDPAVGDVSIFAPAFVLARSSNLPITIHFAESPASSTPAELWKLLEYGPKRIGHVINVPDDVKEEIVRRGLGLELCLSCNVHAKMITGTYGDHHFGWWWGKGCPIALSVCLFFFNSLAFPSLSCSGEIPRERTIGRDRVRNSTNIWVDGRRRCFRQRPVQRVQTHRRAFQAQPLGSLRSGS